MCVPLRGLLRLVIGWHTAGWKRALRGGSRMGQVLSDLWVTDYFMLVSLAGRASDWGGRLWADLGRHAGGGGLGMGALVHAVGGGFAGSGIVWIGEALLLLGVEDELPLLV